MPFRSLDPLPWRAKRKRSPFLTAACRPARRRRKFNTLSLLAINPVQLAFWSLTIFLSPVYAAFISFDNCLDPGIINSDPLQLQFIPMFFNAKFNTSDPGYNLNITIYGNVSGQATLEEYPSINSSRWGDPNDTLGKIVDIDKDNNRYTTLFSKYKVLTYTPYVANPSQFCQSTVNTSCPIIPSFFEDGSDPYKLSAFTVGHDFYSSYSFATLAATVRVQSGAKTAQMLACVSANITPDLGNRLSDALRYLPAAILALVAIATISAAIFSPWSSSDPFRWTSNYGRDEDLLRLVTPGFGDCLQYIQFVILSGSLSLSYPGFYQPVVSQASWAVLMLNESFVSHGNGSHSLQDGIYVVNATYGLSRLGQLVGMTQDKDIWAGMAVWLLGIIGFVIVLCQLGFFIKWSYRAITQIQEGDLQNKNWPFTGGNIVRIIYNYFLLPVVALSMFQMVVAAHSPPSVVSGAVVLLLLVILVAGWIFRTIFTTRPRAHLFDDLPSVLLYGPLYNTYSDDAAPFAFIPVLLTFIRGVAIGAVQPSGIAQLVLLAICEVILILTLHAFRPFQAPTSMNAYHTFFSIIRLITVLLSVAFVPSLGVSEAPKGWIGYVILLLHAIVLVFGFFLNAVQTLIEVAARLAIPGAEARGGLTKVFGMRQLSRRAHHRAHRSSLNSNAAMLAPVDGDTKSIQLLGGNRSRSLSASSAVLLNQQMQLDQRSSGFDQFSQGGDYSTLGAQSPAPGTPGGAQSPFSYLPSTGGSGGPSSRRATMGAEPIKTDPYYRPPRPRRPTIDPYTPGSRSRGSGASGDWSNKPYEDSPDLAEGDAGEGPSSFSPSRGGIAPAYLRNFRDDSDPNLERRKNTDYTVRESDFYYGITRGPALSSMPSRRLKTGPADPMGPVSTASSWFAKIFGGKRKEKGKGFEVVRSTRAPPPMMALEEDEQSPSIHHEPYRDSPDAEVGNPARESTEKDANTPRPNTGDGVSAEPPAVSDVSEDESATSEDGDSFVEHVHRVSEVPPILGPIDAGGGIELPSRIGSRASSMKPSRRTTRAARKRIPSIPRKSSKRHSVTENALLVDTGQGSSMGPTSTQSHSSASASLHVIPDQHLHPSSIPPVRLPFGSSEPSPSPEHSVGNNSAASSLYHSSEQVLDPNIEQHRAVLADPPHLRGHQGGTPGPDRPVSTGFVHQHLASDSIRPGAYDPNSHLGSSAEVVNSRTPTMRSFDTGRSGNSQHYGSGS